MYSLNIVLNKGLSLNIDTNTKFILNRKYRIRRNFNYKHWCTQKGNNDNYELVRSQYGIQWKFLRSFYGATRQQRYPWWIDYQQFKYYLKTRCVVNATNAPALSQSFKAMFNLFQFQGG
jgi:hypothetical protein